MDFWTSRQHRMRSGFAAPSRTKAVANEWLLPEPRPPQYALYLAGENSGWKTLGIWTSVVANEPDRYRVADWCIFRTAAHVLDLVAELLGQEL